MIVLAWDISNELPLTKRDAWMKVGFCITGRLTRKKNNTQKELQLVFIIHSYKLKNSK